MFDPPGPRPYESRPTGPQAYESRTTGPQTYEPRSAGPQGYESRPTGPQAYESRSTGPQAYEPRPADPQGYEPQPTGPQAYEPPGSRPQASPYVPPGTETTMHVPGPAARPGYGGPQAPEHPAPGHHAPQQPPGRRPQGQHPQGQHPQAPHPQAHRQRPPAPAHAPDDPYKPFVTAGQISGPKTPPPERQQELWNTVFGDNYDAMGEESDGGEGGRRVWLLALVASVIVALVLALVWAFLAGPLSSASGDADAAANPSGDAGRTTAKPSPSHAQASTKPQSIGRLPKYPGEASPRAGVLTDAESAITVARLGGPWRLDSRSEHIRSAYGFATRQYVAAGADESGTPAFAQVMTGPLAKGLAAKYSASDPSNLTPVISAVAFSARNKLFPEGNKVVKTAEQRLSVGGRPARLVAYQVLAGGARTTLVVAAVSTGADLPAIVYMSVPDAKKELLPDVNTVFSSIRPVAADS
ncbi:hypothetical protein DQ384_32290 [Sphaerisporangium album]|uniref:Uncharacterized protein n=1 Tax=Sphaerisporangium album TaxID=509200 RepID=A0A367F436_9ACTN|nr:hypothetical protein DQ384_32290 [Sphaerisporangium album]